MKTQKPAADLLDRSIMIAMQKAPKSAKLEKLEYALLDKPELLEAVQKKIAAWVEANRDAIRRARPERHDRFDDNWYPLHAIAQVAGGDWPVYAKLAQQDATQKGKGGSTDSGLILLAHCRKVFEEAGNPDHMLSQDLVAGLTEPEEWPWGRDPALDPRKLAGLLDPFEIEPKKRRWVKGDDMRRGYWRRDFEKQWELYNITETRETRSKGSRDGSESALTGEILNRSSH